MPTIQTPTPSQTNRGQSHGHSRYDTAPKPRPDTGDTRTTMTTPAKSISTASHQATGDDTPGVDPCADANAGPGPRRVQRLARADKWALATGEGVLFSPAYPQWLESPGFWDYFTVLQARFEPGFSVALVTAEGVELPLTQLRRHWTPDRCRRVYRVAESRYTLIETQTAEPGGAFTSHWSLGPPPPESSNHASAEANAESGPKNATQLGDAPLDAWLVAFTAQPAHLTTHVTEHPGAPGALSFTRELKERHHGSSFVDVELHGSAGSQAQPETSTEHTAESTADPSAARRPIACGRRSEFAAAFPRFALTPFVEMWDAQAGGPIAELRLEGIGPDPRDLDHLAIAVPLTLPCAGPLDAPQPDTAAAAHREPAPTPAPTLARFTLRLTPHCRAQATRPGLPPVPATATTSTPTTNKNDNNSPATNSPANDSAAHGERHWTDYFNALPELCCNDPYVEKYFDYRWFGLKLNHIDGGHGNQNHPAVAEGIDYFHEPITYSAFCHMYEMRWSGVPHTAQGSLLNFLDTQRDDGSIHGRVYAHELVKTDFYHANWGDALLATQAVHPDDDYLATVYPRLARYADWLEATRDPDGLGLISVINHFESGQEFMSRYQAVNPTADTDAWKNTTQLMAVDASVYGLHLRRALTRVAQRLGHGDQAAAHTRRADLAANAILERMWDPDAGMFSDIDPAGLQRTGVRAAVCFYPMLTDLLDDSHVEAMLGHLTDPAQFATDWPIPSSSLQDPYFDAQARWKGKRHNCPWNGRTWPMTNSHVIDGLIRQWRLRPDGADERHPRYRCGLLAAQWLQRFIHLMYYPTHGGRRDLARPNCFEHYNPFTGEPCVYRGIDDYQHSYVNDLLIRGFLGLDVREDNAGHALITLDPLPAAQPWRPGGDTQPLRRIAANNLRIRGRRLDIRIDHDRPDDAVQVAGDLAEQIGHVGQPLDLTWEENR